MLADDWKGIFLGQLNGLPAAGFRKFTTSLLEAEGFQDVTVDDRQGSNQVSGSGIYRAALFGFKVRFLSLRKEAVTKRHFHALEGSIRSHRERGLLIATEIIGKQLREYCQKDSRSSIDVIDGPMLCEACRNRRIGLTVTTHTVDKVETDLSDFGPLAGQAKDGPGFTPGLPPAQVAPAQWKTRDGSAFIPSMNKHASARFCEAWQYMASKIYEDDCRDLCAELLEKRILGNRIMLGKRKEELSASTQQQGCFCTITVGVPPKQFVWLLNHGLSNNEKRSFLQKVAVYAGFTFGRGQQIDIGL